MKQKDYIIEAMRGNGGYATLQQLYRLIDFSTWGTKTPFASVRRIVQTNREFFKIEPGLWALKECEQQVLQALHIVQNDRQSIAEFTHAYYQGIIVEIGNIRGLDTYIPPQDKNKQFLEKRLQDMATVQNIYNFTYAETVKKAKTVDVVWFNERKMPCAFYEVEHTTNFKNSLNKFYELQDFNARFYIVANENRRRQFNPVIQLSIYNSIRELITFVSYESLINQYHLESRRMNRVI